MDRVIYSSPYNNHNRILKARHLCPAYNFCRRIKQIIFNFFPTAPVAFLIFFFFPFYLPMATTHSFRIAYHQGQNVFNSISITQDYSVRSFSIQSPPKCTMYIQHTQENNLWCCVIHWLKLFFLLVVLLTFSEIQLVFSSWWSLVLMKWSKVGKIILEPFFYTSKTRKLKHRPVDYRWLFWEGFALRVHKNIHLRSIKLRK